MTRLSEAAPLQLEAHARIKAVQARFGAIAFAHREASLRRRLAWAEPVVEDAPAPAVEPVVLVCPWPRPGGRPHVTVEEIVTAVAAQFSVDSAKMLSRDRHAKHCFPRQVAMYLARKLTARSMPDIARRCGVLNHTTVWHAMRKIGGMAEADPGFADDLAALSQAIERRSAAP